MEKVKNHAVQIKTQKSVVCVMDARVRSRPARESMAARTRTGPSTSRGAGGQRAEPRGGQRPEPRYSHRPEPRQSDMQEGEPP